MSFNVVKTQTLTGGNDFCALKTAIKEQIELKVQSS